MNFSLSEHTKIDVGWRFVAGAREWREELGEGKGMERGKGGERGKLGRIAPWLLGDRRPCLYYIYFLHLYKYRLLASALVVYVVSTLY